MEERDPFTAQIIGAAIEVHRELGPGLLESVYQKCMEFELTARGIEFRRLERLPILYKGQLLDDELIMDLFFRVVWCPNSKQLKWLFQCMKLSF